MNISAPFIRRPVATTLITIGIALAGAFTYTLLPVAPLPQVDFPTISISASLPGASAQIMASSVATPLERQLGSIAGLSEMTSSSSLGSTSITLQFDLSRNINGAARDVEAAINAARTYLPANLPANPTYRETNPADAPIMILGLTSEKYDQGTLYDQASTIMMQRLSQIEGVGQVVVGGSSLPSVRVDVNPTQLNSFGLTMASVQSLLRLQNSELPLGQISDGQVQADILDNGQLTEANQFKPLIVGYHNGLAVRLSDVARVTDSVENVFTSGYLNGIPSITIIIFRSPGANIIKTNATILTNLPALQAMLPQGIHTTVVLDRTTTIRASVSDVERTLVIAVILVVLVVFLFLRNARATLIPSVAVPVSLIGTFAVMYLCGYSLDNLSLMALTISTGFVLDDAIVVMENISRHLEAGIPPFDAALRGAQEIGFTVFSISMSLVAVFIPLLMMGGIVGRLFREFSVTLATSILVSMFISLTTTPTMCAHLLKQQRDETHGAAYRASEKGFNWMLEAYRHSLVWVLENPALILVTLALIIALNLVVIIKIPKGFFPLQDTGAIVGGVQGPQDASFAMMDASVKDIVRVIKADPAVDDVNAYTGSGNAAFIYMSLKPLNVRKVSATRIINRLEPSLNRLPGASAFLQPVQDIRIGGRLSNALYQYTLESDNVGDLSHWGPILLAQIKKLPGFRQVNSDQQNGGLDVFLTYNRVAAARLGIAAQDLNSSLYASFGQAETSIIYKELNQYYVVLGVAPQFAQSPRGLEFTYPAASSSGATPLDAVSKITETTTPLQVNHTGLFPSVTVSFNLAPGMSLSDATREIGRMHAKLGTPATIRGLFSGTLEAYQQSLSSEPLLIATALFAVYIVLGILYESLVHPLTILSTLPSASIGAMLALILFGMDLNIISIIGIVLLIGIVKKNAIMMIDFALEVERGQGATPKAAIFQACLLRFRPIMMTTMAALFGALPLAFGTGMGAELRRPLGITIVGGLIVSQMLTLYSTPVIYLELDRLRLKLKGEDRAAAAQPARP